MVTYTDNELADANPVLVGRLSKEHMQALFNAIAGSDTMERWQIRLVCDALKAAFAEFRGCC
jgi:hypothetical protein